MKEDWISEDIKAMVDPEGNLLSRERQGKIQVIRDSEFVMIKNFPEETRAKIKEIFLNCLQNREPKYRIKQDIFYGIPGLNWDCDDFVEYEYICATDIAYIKDSLMNSKNEKNYFRRYSECNKCKKYDVVLWSEKPLESNKINDEFAKYAIWDDRKTDAKSKIPIGCCLNNCKGGWYTYYPEADKIAAELMKD